MSARMTAKASVAEIKAMRLALDQATVGVSWANDRIEPMIKAIIGLGDFSSDKAHLLDDRIQLIRRIAMETAILVDDMSGCIDSEARAIREQIEKLEGGAA